MSRGVNFIIFLLIAISFNLGASPLAIAAKRNCAKWTLEQLKLASKATLLEDFKTVEDQLVRSYRLPENFTSAYYGRRIEPYLARPTYAEVAHPEVMYRGMYITPDELKNILTEGMDVEKVKWTAADGGVSFSSNANEAATYIFHSADQRKNGMGVVFAVRMSKKMILADDPVLNSTRTIFKSQESITAPEIMKAYVWGEYGLESLEELVAKAKAGKLKPHETWTNQFDQPEFSR